MGDSDNDQTAQDRDAVGATRTIAHSLGGQLEALDHANWASGADGGIVAPEERIAKSGPLDR